MSEADGAATPERPLVAVYADESCLGNGKEGDNPGAAGGLVEVATRDGVLVRRDFWVAERATTNNRMALRSAIEAFRAIGGKGRRCRVIFTSDSRYLVDGMTDWVHGWAARGWTRKTGAIENLELWKEALMVAAPHEVQWRWVKGHKGHVQNEYANHLATRAAADGTSSGGLVESDFDAWLAAQRAKGAMRDAPDPFPPVPRFAAARPLPYVAPARLP